MKQRRGSGPRVGILEERPVDEPLVGGYVVPARAHERCDGRVAAVGADDQPCIQVLLRSVVEDPHAHHASAVLDQACHRRAHPQFGTRLDGGLRQDRVKQRAAHRHRPAHVTWPLRDPRADLDVFLAQLDVLDDRRAGRADLLHHPESVQERQRLCLEDVRRERVVRERRPLHDRDP
jgi:hypothetical protein